MNEKELTNLVLDIVKEAAPGIAGGLLLSAVSLILPSVIDMLDSHEAYARGEIQIKAHSTLRELKVL